MTLVSVLHCYLKSSLSLECEKKIVNPSEKNCENNFEIVTDWMRDKYYIVEIHFQKIKLTKWKKRLNWRNGSLSRLLYADFHWHYMSFMHRCIIEKSNVSKALPLILLIKEGSRTVSSRMTRHSKAIGLAFMMEKKTGSWSGYFFFPCEIGTKDKKLLQF